MFEVIAANVCSLCACITDSISGTRKKHSQIMGVQILSQVFYGAGSILLKGYSGTAQNVVAILRNLAAMKNIKYKAVEWTLIILGVALGVVGIAISRNAHGFLDWLPIAANLEYSIAVFCFKNNEKALKISFIINMLTFAVFSFGIQNYVGGVSNIVVCAITAVSLIKSPSGAADNGAEAVQTEEEPEAQP